MICTGGKGKNTTVASSWRLKHCLNIRCDQVKSYLGVIYFLFPWQLAVRYDLLCWAAYPITAFRIVWTSGAPFTKQQNTKVLHLKVYIFTNQFFFFQFMKSKSFLSHFCWYFLEEMVSTSSDDILSLQNVFHFLRKCWIFLTILLKLKKVPFNWKWCSNTSVSFCIFTLWSKKRLNDYPCKIFVRSVFLQKINFSYLLHYLLNTTSNGKLENSMHFYIYISTYLKQIFKFFSRLIYSV